MKTDSAIKTRTTSRLHHRKGGMMIFLAFIMIMFLVGAAFCVDVAYMHMVKTELRTAVDAASRAGAETLVRTQDMAAATLSAKTISERNFVAGNGLTLADSDVVAGRATLNTQSGKFDFVPSNTQANSISVVGRRTTGAPDGNVVLFFGNVFGVQAFEPVLDSVAASTVRDIALVLDRSGSMNEKIGDTGLTRLEALKNAVNVFLTEIQNGNNSANVSLTTYSDNGSREISLTSNFASILTAVAATSPDGSTNIFEGLRMGSDSLVLDPAQRPFADKTVVLLTDGNFNTGGTPIPSAILAAERNQTVHTITFSQSADQATMQQVASATGGTHIHADDSNDLADAFRKIAKTLSVTLIQ